MEVENNAALMIQDANGQWITIGYTNANVLRDGETNDQETEK